MAYTLRACIFSFLGLVCWMSCGGSVQTSDGTTGAGGATGTTVGTGATTVGTGGTALSTGGSSGTSGGSGTPADCLLPKEPGPCEAAFRAYWHNPANGVCEPFIYGGCQGNANRFETLAACQAACPGGTPDYDACTRPTDCTIVPVKCCGGCEPAIAETYTAVAQSHLADYKNLQHCELVDCAACMDLPPLERTFPNFVATCTNGQCRMVDIRQTDLVACQENTDCMLRAGAWCCERCASDTVVAINKNAKLSDLVCGSNAPACPPCVPMIPASYQPLCQDGKCVPGLLPQR